MRWIVTGLLIITVVVGAGLVAGPRLLSSAGLLERAEAAASEKLGRTVTVGNVATISFLPPRLTLEDVSIANAEGFSAAPLAKVEKAKIGVALVPLFGGQVVIESFILEAPDIALEARADGTNNWTLGAPMEDTESRQSPSQKVRQAPITGTIIIKDGRASYTAPDTRLAAEAIDAELVLPPLGAPLKFDAAMRLEGQPLTAAVELADPWSLGGGATSQADIALNLGKNSFSGRLDAAAEPLKLSGPITLRLGDPAALAPFLGSELEETLAPFGAVTLEGVGTATTDRVAYRNVRYETALGSGEGELSIDLGKERPSLRARLKAGEMDLRPFFPESLQANDEPNEAGFPAWSEEPLDLSAMSAADAELGFDAARIILPTYELEDISGSLSLARGLLGISLGQATTLGGTAKGDLRLNARRAVPSLAADFNFNDVEFSEAGPALFKTKRLAGRGSITFDIQSSGKSEKALVSNLTGKARASMDGGRLVGINLTELAASGLALVDTIKTGEGVGPGLVSSFTRLRTDAVAPGAETLFELADADLTIAGGTASLGSAQLRSDTMKAVFAGTVNLPAQGLDLSATLSGKVPGAEDYQTLRAPIRVSGTFSEPKVRVDTGPLVSELARGKAAELLGGAGIDVQENETIEDALRNKARGALSDLFGGRKDDDEDE